MMVLFVFLHMSRVFYTAGCKGTRRFNWVIGVILMFLTQVTCFLGINWHFGRSPSGVTSRLTCLISQALNITLIA